MILYANGDSHTAPSWSYIGIVGEKLGLDVVNQAQYGSSNASIIRRTREYIKENKPDFIIIGWSTWEREEWNYQGEYFDVNSSGHNTLPLELQDRYKHWIIEQTPDLVWDKSVRIHEEIFKLHQDLNYLNIKHLFFNCMYKFFNISDFKMWNNSYIGPYDNDSSYYYWLTLQGIVPDEWYHFKEDGHTKWSNKLINYIKENKLL